MKRANQALTSKFGNQEFDRRESINLKEKIIFTMMFSAILGCMGVGVYSVVNWIYRLITNLL